MSEQTITRIDLAEAIYEEIGLSRKDSNELLEMVLDEISDNLISGKEVKISSFGTFTLREKNERIGRNPKTGKEVPITPRRVISFRPSQMMRKKINK
jgi:integration host factor subunit alpha